MVSVKIGFAIGIGIEIDFGERHSNTDFDSNFDTDMEPKLS